jgi:hypothetical protein
MSTRENSYKLSDALGKDHPAARAYSEYLRKFNDENLVYVLSVGKGEGPVDESPALVPQQRELAERLKHVHGLVRVSSLVDAEYPTYPAHQLRLMPMVLGDRLVPAARELMLTDPFWENTYLERNHRRAVLTRVELDKTISEDDQQNAIKQVLASGRATMKDHPSFAVHVVGSKVASYHFSRELDFQQSVIAPLLLLGIALIVWFLFRSLPIAGLSLYYMLATYALSLFVICIFEKGLNPFINFSLLFILVCGTEDFVHLLGATAVLGEEPGMKGRSIGELLRTSARRVFLPCLVTSLTEVIGFGSQIVSDINPIRNFGVYAALGVSIAFCVNFWAIPWMIRIFNIPVRAKARLSSSKEEHRAALTKIGIRKHWILALFVGLTLLPIPFAMKVQVDDDLYGKFVPSHVLTKAIHALEDTFGFTGSLDLVISRPDGLAFLDSGEEARIAGLEEKLGKLQGVRGVRSVQSFQSYLRRVVGVPPLGSADPASSYRANPELRNLMDLVNRRGLLEDLWPQGGGDLKLSLLVDSVSARNVLGLIDEVEKVSVAQGVPVKISGYTAMRASMLDSVVRGFVNSLGITILLIWATFVILFRSVRWSILALIPNLIPLWVTIGAIGVFGLKLDDNLALTVSVLLGIAVNDTIHLVYGILLRIRAGETHVEAVLDTLTEAGSLVAGTNLIFVLVTPLMFLSDILISNRMSLVLSGAIVFAALCDLWLTPALILKFQPRVRGIRVKTPSEGVPESLPESLYDAHASAAPPAMSAT